MSVVKTILQTKVILSEELNKINQSLYQIVLFLARQNRGVLKTKKRVDY